MLCCPGIRQTAAATPHFLIGEVKLLILKITVDVCVDRDHCAVDFLFYWVSFVCLFYFGDSL